MKDRIQDQVRGRLLPLQARRQIDGFWIAENGDSCFQRMPIPESQLKPLITIIRRTLDDYGKVGRQVEKLGVNFDRGNLFVSAWQDYHVGILYSNPNCFDAVDKALHDCLGYMGVPRLSQTPDPTLITSLPVAEDETPNWEDFNNRLTTILTGVMDTSRASRTVLKARKKRFGDRTPDSDEWQSFGEAVLASLPKKRHKQNIQRLTEELQTALQELQPGFIPQL